MRHPVRDAAERHLGFTLVEVIVVVAILGLIVGVGGLAFANLRPPREAAWVTALRRARAEAIRRDCPVRAVVPAESGSPRSVAPGPLFLPDGRAVGPGVDPLTGAPRVAAR